MSSVGGLFSTLVFPSLLSLLSAVEVRVKVDKGRQSYPHSYTSKQVEGRAAGRALRPWHHGAAQPAAIRRAQLLGSHNNGRGLPFSMHHLTSMVASSRPPEETARGWI